MRYTHAKKFVSILGLGLSLSPFACSSGNGNMNRNKFISTANRADDGAISSDENNNPLNEPRDGTPNGQGDPNAIANPDFEIDVSAAAVPGVIGGASLSCSFLSDSRELSCRTIAIDTKPIDPAIVDAYLIIGPDHAWTKASFTHTGFGLWKLLVPADITGSFAIGLVDGNAAMVFDWVMVGDQSPANLIQDGSFEALVPANGANYLYVSPGDQLYWKSRLTARTRCPYAFVELLLSSVIVPVDGNQSAELDTGCPTTGAKGAGDIALYQDVNLQAEHAYRLVFYYQRRGEYNDLQQFITRVDGRPLLNLVATENRWIRKELLFFARHSGPVRIEFEEIGLPNEWGTLLDNIALFDFGRLP